MTLCEKIYVIRKSVKTGKMGKMCRIDGDNLVVRATADGLTTRAKFDAKEFDGLKQIRVSSRDRGRESGKTYLQVTGTGILRNLSYRK